MRVRWHAGAVVFEYAGDPEWAAIRATEFLRDNAGPQTHVTIKNVDNGSTTSFAAHELLDAEEGFKMFARLCEKNDSVSRLVVKQAHADILANMRPVDRLVARAQAPGVPTEEEEEPDEYSEQALAQRMQDYPEEAVWFMQWYNKNMLGNLADAVGYEVVDDKYVVGRDFEVLDLEDAPAEAQRLVDEAKQRGNPNAAETFFRNTDYQQRQYVRNRYPRIE